MAWCLIKEAQGHLCLFNLTLSDNIHLPVFIQNDVSETGLYLRPEIKNLLGYFEIFHVLFNDAAINPGCRRCHGKMIAKE
jgi:hypothetical protein